MLRDGSERVHKRFTEASWALHNVHEEVQKSCLHGF